MSSDSALLERHGQAHLLRFWPQLGEDERSELTEDIRRLDFEEANEFFARATESLSLISEKLDDRLKPIPTSQYDSVRSMSEENFSKYEDIGLSEIGSGKVGVLLLAGGQGTRLGFAHPKGMYDVGLPSHKSLFQIQAERIRRLQEIALERTGKDGKIVWYIMTSEHTMRPTLEYLKKNNYFELDPENVVMFEQGTLPCYDFDGKIFLDEKHRLSSAPDGNGGLYRALKTKGILEDFERRGVLHLHAHSVDNILCKVADPVFIGYCAAKNADCAAKVVQKSSPTEAVGVVCKVDGLYKVVEYSEITQETAERRNSDGNLTFNAGNICNHYFTSSFLKRVSTDYESKLKLHVAKKKIPYVDENGDRRKADEPNGIKIEKFIFDVFEFAENFVTLEVERDEEFTALKNLDSVGRDCPSQARGDLFKLHRKYVRNAGGIIGDDVDVEISPLLSYAGENLEDLVSGEDFVITPFHLKSQRETEAKPTMNGKH